MSTCGEATARTIRSVIGLPFHPQLGVDAGDDDVELRQDLVVVVERAVLEDVDLDAGEDAERRHLLVEDGDVGELLLQPLPAQPVGDRQPGRVIGEHHVFVAETSRGARHRLDGRAAVAPPAVHVAVAAQRGAVAGTVVGHLDLGLGLDLVDVARVAMQGLGDQSGRRIADPLEVGQRAGGGPCFQLVGRDGPDDFERPDERLRLEPGVVGPIEAVHHTFEGVDRGHVIECR